MSNMLRNDRIYLRTIEPSDIDLLLKWENDPANWSVSGTTVPFSRHLMEQYIQSAQDIFAVRQLRMMISLPDGTTIGAVDLFEFEPTHLRAGVGILIDEPYRKKGLASEALSLLEVYCTDHLRLRNLWCNILETNAGSAALFEKSGYRLVGWKKRWFNDGEKWLDEWLYQKELKG
jgi:diamine N-acetyltransferase